MNKFLLFLLVLVANFSLRAQKISTINILADSLGRDISPKMWGIFFEDINLGADGGLYAELVKNRSFEFNKPLDGWKVLGGLKIYGLNINNEVTIINNPKANNKNPKYCQIHLLNTTKGSLGITNDGFRGMGIKKDLTYDFSILYRQNLAGKKIHLELLNDKDEIIGEKTIILMNIGHKWQQATTTFKATETCTKAKLKLWFEGTGTLDIDIVSLFPSDTWKGRKGGLRADMVQILADMKPGFIRFPGGCIVEGRDLASRYQWKNTVGPVANRKLIINRWNDEFAHRPTPDYFQTFGLGFFEYFQMAEDIGAEPLPILSCGIACQFNTGELVPLSELDGYIQDALDLIEFANGKANTPWGKVRAQMGHAEPFNLKMIGVGNENWGLQYIERLQLFQKAILAKYPYIKIVGSSGVTSDGPMFEMLDGNLRKLKIDFIDEHYYNKPDWFLANAKRYDSYDRKSISKVFAGEYAGQSDKVVSAENHNNWHTALAEAAFMTGLERNGDVVQMASYAPLFGHMDGWQWKPNLIWVDNLKVMATPNYHVQKLFSTNNGHKIVVTYDNSQKPYAGQDSLYASTVYNKITKELIVKIVNNAQIEQTVNLNLKGIKKWNSTVVHTVIQHNNLQAENTMENPEVIKPQFNSIALSNSLPKILIAPQSLNVFKFKLEE